MLQRRWSLMRLRALAGVLGVRFEHVVLYTAFRKDEMLQGSGPAESTRR